MRRILTLISMVTVFTGCASTIEETEPAQLTSPLAQAQTVKLFVGQDLGAVGGLDDYNQGYVDYFGAPSGVTIYTGLSTLEGLNSKVNYGAGDNYASLYLEDERFDGVDMAIGLYLVDQLAAVNSGELDGKITELAKWIGQSERTVYLRIGYEFEGSWNGYSANAYQKAYRRIVDGMRKEGVDNVQFVWQSSGYEEQRDNLMSYYPGDNYVDWMSYSYFNHDPDEAGIEMLRLAREKNKPVMIAELTPRGSNLMYDDGKSTWDNWFAPFLSHLEKNKDVIGIIAYINANWDEQAMWKGQGWGDTRLQSNLYIANKWRRTIVREEWAVKSTQKQPPIFILPDDYEEQKLKRNKQAQTLVPNENQRQAEDAIPAGNVRIYPDSLAVGGKGMAYMYAEGDSLTFEGVAQSNFFSIRYASERSGKIGLFVDGIRRYDIEFDSTGSWVGSYKKVEFRVDIPSESEVSIRWETGDAALNVDYVLFDRR
ncbi:glycosyl hydrolase [uncultured Vibrio sp.]|uniref:glycosyl hydrolase n=1 Tax=uncultured Vibrio sp. TaxID=114054 RepID=UPI0025EB23D9|nr:glycosyl hydrolase [uncultured Vibrio sp.]